MEPKISTKNWSTHTFSEPKKCIISVEDVEKFKKMRTFVNFMTFIQELQKSVESKPASITPQSPKFKELAACLDKLEKLIDEVPPLQQKMRYGNKAFRTWHEKVQPLVDKLIADLLPPEKIGALIELKVYFMDSFGSYERIDYGTGHELSFILFLFCLRELELYGSGDYEALLRNVFYRYIKLMRKLQLTYMLEPAGSHGVWGLDDYHFLPFLFGASELIDHPKILTPNEIHNDKTIEEFYQEYIYLDCIKFIKDVKSGTPFYETSPVLNDISAAPSWRKVANGMIKMYQGEVLFKHPVIKHMYFGSLIPFE